MFRPSLFSRRYRNHQAGAIIGSARQREEAISPCRSGHRRVPVVADRELLCQPMERWKKIERIVPMTLWRSSRLLARYTLAKSRLNEWFSNSNNTTCLIGSFIHLRYGTNRVGRVEVGRIGLMPGNSTQHVHRPWVSEPEKAGNHFWKKMGCHVLEVVDVRLDEYPLRPGR